MAGVKTEYILSLDKNEPLIQEYANLFDYGQFIENNNSSVVDAINVGVKSVSGNIIIVMSDDTECPDNWGQKLLEVVDGKTDFILKTKDGIQPWIITMPIMDRTYYNRFGYIYYPEYKHMFCDTELTCVADILGRKIESNLLFPHKQYSVTGEKPDEINRRADKTWDQGEKLFLERYKKNFDLPQGGKIQDSNMINWLLRKNKMR